MSRRETREQAVRSVYQMEIAKATAEEVLENIEDGQLDPYLKELVTEIEQKKDQLDTQISPLLKGWKMDRLPQVDRAILRVAVYELLYRKDIPPAVVINEAVELSKIYGDQESSKFVNGVLSNLLKGKTEQQ